MMFEKLSKKNKGQGALEYLLIIGGALVIAVIVVTLILSIGKSNNESAIDSQNEFAMMIDNTITPPIVTSVSCQTDKIIVYMNPASDPRVKGYRIKKDNEVLIPNTATTFLDYSSGKIEHTFNAEVNAGTKHKISVIAYKNDSQSRPSTPSFNCTVQ